MQVVYILKVTIKSDTQSFFCIHVISELQMLEWTAPRGGSQVYLHTVKCCNEFQSYLFWENKNNNLIIGET